MISFCKRLGAFVTRLPATSFALSSLSTALLAMPATSFAAGADYDGNGFSEIPVITQGSDGTYTWNLFDPISGKSTVFTSRFGRGGESIILANWLYPTVTSAGVLSAPTVHSAGRLVWTIRTTVVNKGRRGGAISKIQQHTKYLGRTGDIIVTGGDFDGDRVADAVVITNRGTGSYKWGLRGSFFLSSYNPALNSNRAYFDFGRFGSDKPFFLNPDGVSDWFAVLRRQSGSGYEVALTQPFTQETRVIDVGEIPDGNRVPIPVGQDDGSDILLFSGTRSGVTTLVVKDLRGATIRSRDFSLVGDITVGNYGPGSGEEIAVSSAGRFVIWNPITDKVVELSGPSGTAADSINITTGR